MKKLMIVFLSLIWFSTTVWADPIICGSVHLTIYNTKAQIVSPQLTITVQDEPTYPQSADDISGVEEQLGVESISAVQEPLGVKTPDDVEITPSAEEPDTTSDEKDIDELLVDESDIEPLYSESDSPLFGAGEDFDEEHND